MSRYAVGGDEGEHEPGSDGRVVVNGLGMTDPAAMDDAELALLLSHPFRQGNRRIARFVADVMASQAGMGPLDYSAWDEHKQAYIGAIHAGMDCDDGPMEALVTRALDEGSGSARTRGELRWWRPARRSRWQWSSPRRAESVHAIPACAPRGALFEC